jgi:hypothetical protein
MAGGRGRLGRGRRRGSTEGPFGTDESRLVQQVTAKRWKTKKSSYDVA